MDAQKRQTSYSLTMGGVAITSGGWHYDAVTGRIDQAGPLAAPAGYGYLPGSDWLFTTGLAGMVTTRTPDGENRLATIATARNGAPIESHTWTYNPLTGTRDRDTLLDGSRWDYTHNTRGEVTGAALKTAAAVALDGYGFGFTFDPIGNRRNANVNGRDGGYHPNALNQYEHRKVFPYLDVLGSAEPSEATRVMVAGPRGRTMAIKQGPLFHAAVPVDNSAASQYPLVTVDAVKASGNSSGTDYEQKTTGKLYLPKTPEFFVHDDDGNMTQDGRWSNSWDAENRLIAMETLPAAVSAGVTRIRLECRYDWKGRRIQKTVRTGWNGSTYTNAAITNFLYEGWNLLAELDGGNNIIRRYHWGLDLSATRQGAGGIGGLLLVEQVAAPNAGTYQPFYDGNGNIMGLLNAADGTEAARYTRGPFGEELRATGVMAEANPFRFSTKYTDAETGMTYYGGRYYDPSEGRWLARDAIGENGGVNLYGFVLNDPLKWVDVLGNEPYQPSGPLLGNVIFAPDEHFLPGVEAPNALRADHSKATFKLKTKTKVCPCTAAWKMIVWDSGSPNLDIMFNAPNGSGWHEEAHAYGYLQSYRLAKAKITEYLDKCFGGTKLLSALFIVGNRQSWVGSNASYLDLALHVGQSPYAANKAPYTYPDSDPLKPTLRAVDDAKAKVDALDRSLRTYEEQFRSAP